MAKRKRSRLVKRTVAAPLARPAVSNIRLGPLPVAPLSSRAVLRPKLVLATSQHTYHSRNSGEAARLSQHQRRAAAVSSIAEKRKRHSGLSLAAAKPDERKSSEKAREAPHCKKRPDSKKAARGAGGSRRFVPWCG